MNWDTIVSVLIILVIVLGFWAKITKKTIGEVIMDIRDIFGEGKEEVEERVGDVIEYE